MYYRIKALVIKEILAILRDKHSRVALIAPPIFQLLILAHAATLEVRNISIGVYNQDSGWYSQELINRLKGSPYFKKVYTYDHYKQVRQGVDTQEVLLSIQFPADFSRRIGAQKTGDVQFILDGRKTNASQIVSGYINQIIQKFNQEILAQGEPESLSAIPTLEFRAWFNPNLDYILYNVPCLVAILSMIISLAVTSLSIAREREMGTFDQLLVSPLQTWQILVGKMLPALIISVVESSFIMLLSIWLFNIPFNGSFILFYISMVVFVFSILGAGLFISSLSNTQQQASLGSFVFTSPTIILSGYATPVENMPDWLQAVSYCFPLTHYLIITKGVFLKSMDFDQILMHIIPMLLAGLLTMTLAGWMFRKHQE
jgi:ABC-2 type transport system permease protein